VTDPVCGMQIDPITAPEHRNTETGTLHFCSAHCAAAFDAAPGRYGTTPTGHSHPPGKGH
jgi:Cu+-exporting ATPase